MGPGGGKFDHVLFCVNDFHPSLRTGSGGAGTGGMEWQQPLADKWEQAGGSGEVTLCADVREALGTMAAIDIGTASELRVLVTGSLLLVGDMVAELGRRGLWEPTYP